MSEQMRSFVIALFKRRHCHTHTIKAQHLEGQNGHDPTPQNVFSFPAQKLMASVDAVFAAKPSVAPALFMLRLPHFRAQTRASLDQVSMGIFKCQCCLGCCADFIPAVIGAPGLTCLLYAVHRSAVRRRYGMPDDFCMDCC